ncbi:putative 1,3-beta-glucan synthase [Helianthus annuus]|nr:putative 1,3-beta-glucan synthase [Helianthus annuus]KAJ0787185.1 putative 1,3-beta-glucan synthase [Helianthus annuus]
MMWHISNNWTSGIALRLGLNWLQSYAVSSLSPFSQNISRDILQTLIGDSFPHRFNRSFWKRFEVCRCSTVAGGPSDQPTPTPQWRIMRTQTAGNLGESIFDSEVVSSSLVEIAQILRMANEVEPSNPRVAYLYGKVLDALQLFDEMSEINFIFFELYMIIFSSTVLLFNSTKVERTSKFRKQANAIAEWDRRILQNRDVLLKVEVGELEATDGMTPLDVVVRILNNQLSSLMWIDEKVMLFFHIFIFLSLSSLNVVHKCLSDFEYCFFFSETINSVILRKC